MRICSYLPAARVICESDSWRSERDVDAERVRARSWIGHVVETARSDIALAIGVAIGQRRGEEITTLRCVTLRLVDQRGVVEGLAAELSAPQPARIEVAPREVVV